MKRILIILVMLAALALPKESFTQTYKTALGARLTYWWGLTVKHHISDAGAIEGILNWRWGGWVLNGLYEHHFPAFGVDGLRWYLGGGAHIGYWHDNGGRGNKWFTDYPDSHVGIGLDLIGGIEYTLSEIPLNFSLDLKPAMYFVPGFWPAGDEGALSIRYCF